MTSASTGKRRPSIQITLARAARLYQIVRHLSTSPCRREQILDGLRIGLRTFYREIAFLERSGIKVARAGNEYRIKAALEVAEDRLPFPDPQLSFAEMRELSRLAGPTSRRLAALLESVVNPSAGSARKKPTKRKTK